MNLDLKLSALLRLCMGCQKERPDSPIAAVTTWYKRKQRRRSHRVE